MKDGNMHGGTKKSSAKSAYGNDHGGNYGKKIGDKGAKTVNGNPKTRIAGDRYK